MSMNQQTVQQAANALLDAYETRAPIAPLTDAHGSLSLDDAYDIQLAQVARWTGDGRTVRGHKIGLTSAAMQRQLGVDQPDYGHLMDDMFLPDPSAISVRRFLQPRLEPELAFVLRERLAGPGVTTADAARAVDFVLPALEVIDSRIADWKIKLPDTIADNASSGAVVLGSHPTRLGEVDLRLAGCVLTRNGAVVETGAGGAVLGDPLLALCWLANVLGARGVALEPGHVILSGACTAAVPARAGDVFTATFNGLGSVSAAFTDPGGRA